tara:strand:+ start:168 stop:542 length:375 start_codon:yes stop_codon:yes gene_type:complete
MISSNLKSQIEKANNNVFMSKEISGLFEKEDIKTSALSILIKNDKDLNFDILKLKSKKKYYKFKILATKSQVKNLFSSKIKNISFFIKDYKVFKLNNISLFIEYSIVKKDINSYVVCLKVKKEK